MIFYEKGTLVSLIIASLPAIAGAYFFYIKNDKKLAIILLLITAFLLRLIMITLDPFIHEWDERFHGLVAKNMISNPFRPMLFVNPVLPYQLEDWSYNHIWVHKQPLFLWQMALSMKLFGINTIALRLPSAILGTVMVWLTYDMANKWLKDDRIAFLSAFITATAYYALELTSGWRSLEHNDMIFTFYATCSFWAFTKYVYSPQHTKWAIITGVFVGFAILNKWLVGLLVYGGWGLYLLLCDDRWNYRKYLHLILSIGVACIIFLPWQLYIINTFPVESAIAFEYNRKHITSDLGHDGNVFTHLGFLPTAYQYLLVCFIAIGMITIFESKKADYKISVAFLAMIVVIFSFFSIVVATKMPAFVYPVSALMIILMAYGIFYFWDKVFSYLQLIPLHRNQLLMLITIVAGFLSLKVGVISHDRSIENQYRNSKMHNASLLNSIDDQLAAQYIFLNCKSYESIEMMFYKNTTAYHWYPAPNTIDSLQALGHKFAAFQFPAQTLPAYIAEDKEILILETPFR